MYENALHLPSTQEVRGATEDSVRLIDFGHSWSKQDARKLDYPGTLPFTAPEIFRAKALREAGQPAEEAHDIEWIRCARMYHVNECSIPNGRSRMGAGQTYFRLRYWRGNYFMAQNLSGILHCRARPSPRCR